MGDRINVIGDRLKEWLGDNKDVVVLAVAGVGMVAMGVNEWWRSQEVDSKVEIVEASPDTQGVIGGTVVDVGGAVARPGVYRLPVDARVGEALEAAGGLRSDASKAYVAEQMNLAAKLVDGSKVFVPIEGKEADFEGQNQKTGSVAAVSVININLASESELESLSGIGPARAKAIISNRPYSAIDELVVKKVIPQSVFDEIKDKVGVY